MLSHKARDFAAWLGLALQLHYLEGSKSMATMSRDLMIGESVEDTLTLWASSLRDAKQRIRPLFTQERVAAAARQFLDGLLGNEPRKTGWMRGGSGRRSRPVAPAGDPGPGTVGGRRATRYCT